MRKIGLILALVLTGLLARAASLKEGTKEIRADGLYDPTTPAGPLFQAGLTLGYFVPNNVEIGGRFSLREDDQMSVFSAGPFAEINFDLGNEFVPFVGAALEYVHGDTDGDSRGALALSGYGGAKYFLAENVAVSAKLELSAATDKVYSGEDGPNSTDFTFVVGMSYYIR